MQTFKRENHRQFLPGLFCSELLCFLGQFPLARLDFRLGYHGQVTCSDASNLGGGICVSGGLTKYVLRFKPGSFGGSSLSCVKSGTC